MSERGINPAKIEGVGGVCAATAAMWSRLDGAAGEGDLFKCGYTHTATTVACTLLAKIVTTTGDHAAKDGLGVAYLSAEGIPQDREACTALTDLT